MNETKTGTTTVGIIAKDGVVLATESKATIGNLISDKHVKKIIQIDEHIAITTAGSVGDVQVIGRFLASEAKMYRVERRRKIPVGALATLLSNVLNSNRFFPYLGQFILAGYDTQPKLYELDPIGGMIEKKYSATGSGSPIAYGILEDGYQEDMNVEDGIKLAIRAIKAASERDAFSGGNINLAVITKKGFQELNAEEYM